MLLVMSLRVISSEAIEADNGSLDKFFGICIQRGTVELALCSVSLHGENCVYPRLQCATEA
jgi:hypothetical protein